MELQRYPVVMKGEFSLDIVYHDRIEQYQHVRTVSREALVKDLGSWSPLDEIENLKGNGYHVVHAKEKK